MTRAPRRFAEPFRLEVTFDRAHQATWVCTLFLLHRLVRHPSMFPAIGTVVLPAPTVGKAIGRRIAYGPLTHVLTKREDGRRTWSLVHIPNRFRNRFRNRIRHNGLRDTTRSGRLSSCPWRSRSFEHRTCRFRGLCPAREAETMHLADNCVRVVPPSCFAI